MSQILPYAKIVKLEKVLSTAKSSDTGFLLEIDRKQTDKANQTIIKVSIIFK